MTRSPARSLLPQRRDRAERRRPAASPPEGQRPQISVGETRPPRRARKLSRFRTRSKPRPTLDATSKALIALIIVLLAGLIVIVMLLIQRR